MGESGPCATIVALAATAATPQRARQRMSKRKRTSTLPRARYTSEDGAYTAQDAPVAVAEPPADIVQAPLRWYRGDTLILLAGVLFTILVYAWRLDKPEVFVFDEVYHAYTAGQLAKGNSDAYYFTVPAPEPGVAYEWT